MIYLGTWKCPFKTKAHAHDMDSLNTTRFAFLHTEENYDALTACWRLTALLRNLGIKSDTVSDIRMVGFWYAAMENMKDD
jgi:hypothetical protein